MHWGYSLCIIILSCCAGNEWVHWGYSLCIIILSCCAGNEWVHWGYPPCGAKKHMDLMQTSRVSVQIKGSKHWRLYSLMDSQELTKLELANWTKVRFNLLFYIFGDNVECTRGGGRD